MPCLSAAISDVLDETKTRVKSGETQIKQGIAGHLTAPSETSKHTGTHKPHGERCGQSANVGLLLKIRNKMDQL